MDADSQQELTLSHMKKEEFMNRVHEHSKMIHGESDGKAVILLPQIVRTQADRKPAMQKCPKIKI